MNLKHGKLLSSFAFHSNLRLYAKDITVSFQGDSKVYSAELLGYDDDKDVAVLKVVGPG